VRDVSLTVETGEILAVLGANGVGKSSLLKVIAGDLEPMGGSVRIRGLPPAARPARARARLLAVLPESEPLPYDFPASAVVALGRYPHQGLFGRRATTTAAPSRARSRSPASTDRCARINELSAGERQRVLLARASRRSRARAARRADGAPRPGPAGERHGDAAPPRDRAHHRGVAVLHEPNLAARYADRVPLLGRSGRSRSGCGAT
jgi:iron complex transport system ATP-binding protein